MARRKRSKGGRRKLKGMIRTPSGRISQSDESKQVKKSAYDAAERETQREAMETAVTARMRHTGLCEELARKNMAGFVLGLLRIDNRITEREFEAGQRYGTEMAEYYHSNGMPLPSPRAMDMFAVKGYIGDETVSMARRARKSANRRQELEAILLSRPQGRIVKTKVFEVCVEDMASARNWNDGTIWFLKCGLNALGDEYGLDKDQEQAA